MSRFSEFSGELFPFAANGTVTVSQPKMPVPTVGRSLIGALATLSGVGGTLANLARVVTKQGGNDMFNLSGVQYRHWFEAESFDHISYGGADTTFLIAFNDIAERDEDEADLLAFPLQTIPTIELSMGAVGAGNIEFAWLFSTQNPTFARKLLRSQMGVPIGSTSGADFNISEAGVLNGFLLPTTGLTQIEVHAANDQPEDLLAAALIAQQRINGATTLVDPLYVKISPVALGGFGTDKLKVHTDGAWGGLTEETVLDIGVPNSLIGV